jgi:hypothetical protein
MLYRTSPKRKSFKGLLSWIARVREDYCDPFEGFTGILSILGWFFLNSKGEPPCRPTQLKTQVVK